MSFIPSDSGNVVADSRKCMHHKHHAPRLRRRDLEHQGHNLRLTAIGPLGVSRQPHLRNFPILTWLLRTFFARAAEMISGIVCGCLPILPQFFRHYVPKITTKLSLFYQRTRRSRSTEGSNTIYSGQSMTHRRAGPLDLPAYSSNYLELKERDGLERTQGYSFTVEGSQGQESQTFVDLEDGSPKHGIQKTVRIETRS